MKKKICFVLCFILYIFIACGDDKTMEELRNGLFGISVTTWVYEDFDYVYSLNFETPDKITFIYYIKEKNTGLLKMNVIRNDIFEIENNILKINFSKSQHDVYNTLGEWSIENLTIRIEVEIIEKTKLFVKQTFGKNIFEKNTENIKLEFKANILETLI